MQGEISITVTDGAPGNETIKINHKKFVKGTIKVFFLSDGEFRIAYTPALNFTGYGKDDDEAGDMLKEIIKDYLETLVNMSPYKAQKELEKYGWEKVSIFSKKKFENRSFVNKNGVLRNLDLPEDTPITESKLELA